MRRGDRFALLWPCHLSPLSLMMALWRAYLQTLLLASPSTRPSGPPHPSTLGSAENMGCLCVKAVSPGLCVTLYWAANLRVF